MKIVILLILQFWPILGMCVSWISVRKLRRLVEQQRLAVSTTNQWCDADDAFTTWFAEHPSSNITHPEAQELLKTLVGAYMLWLDAHPYIDDEGHLAFLVSHIED